MRKIFLACPYGDPDDMIVKRRFEICNEISANILRTGAVIFSQVSMSHPINLALRKLGEISVSQLWTPVDEVFMDAMDELIVIDIDGWDRSSGVAREIAFFGRKGQSVSLWSNVKDQF